MHDRTDLEFSSLSGCFAGPKREATSRQLRLVRFPYILIVVDLDCQQFSLPSDCSCAPLPAAMSTPIALPMTSGSAKAIAPRTYTRYDVVAIQNGKISELIGSTPHSWLAIKRQLSPLYHFFPECVAYDRALNKTIIQLFFIDTNCPAENYQS